MSYKLFCHLGNTNFDCTLLFAHLLIVMGVVMSFNVKMCIINFIFQKYQAFYI